MWRIIIPATQANAIHLARKKLKGGIGMNCANQTNLNSKKNSLIATFLAMLVFISLIGCGSTSTIGRRTLSGDEVRKLFAGKTVQGYHEKRNYAFTSYYEPDGTFRSYQGGSKTPRHAKWSVSDNGDICVYWQDTKENLCRKMVTDDRGNYWKVLFKKTRKGTKRILIVTFKSFAEGNPNNL